MEQVKVEVDKLVPWLFEAMSSWTRPERKDQA
jgi:hypothetical protein